MRARQISGTQLRASPDGDTVEDEDEDQDQDQPPAEPSPTGHVTLLPPPGTAGDAAAHLAELAAATVPSHLMLQPPSFNSFEQEFWNHQPTPPPLSAAPDIALPAAPVAPLRQKRRLARSLFAIAALTLAAIVLLELCSLFKLF